MTKRTRCARRKHLAQLSGPCPLAPANPTMTHVDYLEKLRDYVRSNLSAMGADLEAFQETILIRNGHYCGRRFRAGAFEAVWFSDENELKFYAPEGGVARVERPLTLSDEPRSRVA